MKVFLSIAVLLISINLKAQEQEPKRPIPGVSISISDTTFVEIANRIGNASKLINGSSIAVKDAKPVTEALDQIIMVLNAQMLAESKKDKSKAKGN